jgi:hypothetical protein
VTHPLATRDLHIIIWIIQINAVLQGHVCHVKPINCQNQFALIHFYYTQEALTQFNRGLFVELVSPLCAICADNKRMAFLRCVIQPNRLHISHWICLYLSVAQLLSRTACDENAIDPQKRALKSHTSLAQPSAHFAQLKLYIEKLHATAINWIMF